VTDPRIRISVVQLNGAQIAVPRPDLEKVATLLAAAGADVAGPIACDWEDIPADGFVALSLGLVPETFLQQRVGEPAQGTRRLVCLDVERQHLPLLAGALQPAAMIQTDAFTSWLQGSTHAPPGLTVPAGVLALAEAALSLGDTGYLLSMARGAEITRGLIACLGTLAAGARREPGHRGG
jgi:hypothetical protein